MKFRYQFAFFADLKSLQPTPENTMSIFGRLNERKLGVLPSTMQELVAPSFTPETRLQFSNAESGLEIAIPRNRLDIVQQYQSVDGPGLGTIQEFADVAQSCVDAVIDNLPIPAYRLALVVQDMYPSTEAETMTLQFLGVFNSPDFYKENSPTEWTFRANANVALTFADRKEVVNVISKVDRLQGEMASSSGRVSFDRVLCEFDINTKENTRQGRFDRSLVKSFILSAADLQERLSHDLDLRLRG